MRYMMMLRVQENTDVVPSEQLMADMGKLIEDMTKAGVLLDTGGLRPTSEGTRIRLSGGKLTVIDGPFTEAKEVIGGYAMIQAKSEEEALEWASRFLRIHGDEWEIESEIRQIEGPND
ncbi:YciI family protein [Streptomyces sp. H10-C2]|uniref:YciI family protein n=1 Tax=unclassified Streptomyces TaxID=2593676 RepID=UPI0024BAEA13|nr:MULTISPECIES: YciI family protein [unclassified Streptomyces]MDJ0345065.1 YciI family protein [Streptomyces sp. PH10-H1]MDJ0373970.1 YciI family protein [Streptomyces sp. H10-C2]